MSSDMFTLSITDVTISSFVALGLQATEEIGRPFRYRLSFSATNAITPLATIGKQATVTIPAGRTTVHTATGVVVSFTAYDRTPDNKLIYGVEIAPRLALLDLQKQTQVYGGDGTQTVVDIITDKIANGAASTSTSGGHGQTLVSNISNIGDTYPALLLCTQWQESDLDFVNRLCEENGICYLVEGSSSGETIKFSDSNSLYAFANVEGANRVTMSPPTGPSSSTSLCMMSFVATAKAVTKTFGLRDRNELTSINSDLFGEAAGDNPSFGAVVDGFGNFQTVDEGNRRAEIRRDAAQFGRTVYVGVSNVPQLRAGSKFTLANHANSSLNTTYLVVSVEHSSGSLEHVGGGSSNRPTNAQPSTQPYKNRLHCVPLGSTTYRRPLSTARPRAGGVYFGKIEATGTVTRAQIDSYGRYRIRLVVDEATTATTASGSASSPVRKLEPYGNNASGKGQHFPLLAGTEVLVSFVNGDPDRPIILGALADATILSPVIATNQVVNRIQTTSGVVIEINDGT